MKNLVVLIRALLPHAMIAILGGLGLGAPVGASSVCSVPPADVCKNQGASLKPEITIYYDYFLKNEENQLWCPENVRVDPECLCATWATANSNLAVQYEVNLADWDPARDITWSVEGVDAKEVKHFQGRTLEIPPRKQKNYFVADRLPSGVKHSPWTYGVTGTKTGCADAVADPQIIFTKGGGGTAGILAQPFTLLAVLLSAIALFTSLWVLRRLRR